MRRSSKTAKRILRLGAIVLLCAVIAGYTGVQSVFSAVEYNEAGKDFSVSDDKLYIYISGQNSLLNTSDYFGTLREIYIENCELDDLDVFAKSKIEKLIISDTTVKKKLTDFPDTLKEIEIENTDLDFEAIKGCEIITVKKRDFYKFDCDFPNCTELTIDSCSIYSLDGIQNNKNVEKLEILNTLIDSIDPVVSLPKLTELKLCYTMVKDISCLENSSVSDLFISDSPIDSIRPMTKMKNLKKVYANNLNMAFDEESVDYLLKNTESTHISKDGLEIKNKVIRTAKEIFNPSMSDREKVFAAAEYVILHMDYDSDIYSDDDLNSAYGVNSLYYAVEKGMGTCMNYTVFTSALLRAAGVEVFEQRSLDHIWNICRIDGKYYCLDTTMSDNNSDAFDPDSLVFTEYENAEQYFGFSSPTSVPAPLLARGDEKDETAEAESEKESVSAPGENKTVIVITVCVLLTAAAAAGIILIKKKK